MKRVTVCHPGHMERVKEITEELRQLTRTFVIVDGEMELQVLTLKRLYEKVYTVPAIADSAYNLYCQGLQGLEWYHAAEERAKQIEGWELYEKSMEALENLAGQ